MSYRLNKTDGSVLVDLIDGSIDTDTTNLTLVGRNYTGFGEFLNENFIKLLENFSSTAAPTNPIEGQLWYDSSESRLKLYNGSEFVVAGAALVQSSQPQMIAGDLWINNGTNQIYFFDGTDLVLIGPTYTAQQGKSGFETVDIRDIQSRVRRILKLWISNQLVAIVSNLTFTPRPEDQLTELPGEIKKGITFVDNSTFKLNGTAEYASNLITGDGTVVSADAFSNQFLRTDTSGTITGSLTIQSNNGIIIGSSSNNVQKIQGSVTVVENTIKDTDYVVKIRSSQNNTISNPTASDAITVKALNKTVGIFNSSPEHTLDVDGDCRITGNLTVEGNATYINVTNLQVEDKNIELLGKATGEDSTMFLNRSQLDDAGVIVRSQEGEIKLTYQYANDSWTSTEHLNLASGKTFKINGDTVLTNTKVNVTTVESSSSLNLTSNGEIVVNDQRITGIASPVDASDAVNKEYVETLVVNFSLDITGLTNNQIALVIDDLYPSTARPDGTTAKVHTIKYDVQNFTPFLSKSFVAVDANGGTNNESVLQDVAVSGNPTLSATRGLKQFVISGGVWTFDADLPSSV